MKAACPFLLGFLSGTLLWEDAEDTDDLDDLPELALLLALLSTDLELEDIFRDGSRCFTKLDSGSITWRYRDSN